MDSNKKVWIYDLEQFPNYHCGTFMDRDNEKDIRTFIIYGDRNDALEYNKFLKNEVAGLIGFNCVNYDYPLLHFFMNLMRVAPNHNSIQLNMLLFDESSRIINAEYSAIPEYQTLIPQLDLFKIHHFDNKNKSTSLKELEIVMRMDNVMEMPLGPTDYVQDADVDKIVEYNINDVHATRKFYYLSIDMIGMRKKLSAKYGLNFRNANDPKIGQEIFLHKIADKKGIPYRYLKDMRTYRHSINLGECIVPYIKFNSKEFNTLLDDLKSTVIETTYKAFEKSVIYKGFKYDYGTGGIHGCIESGIYEESETHLIEDIDVKSYYPNLAIANEFYPQHLGIDFVYVTKELFDQRVTAQKEGDAATNSGLKLALNGVTGKSNDKFSPLYDPKYNMSITVNGQLLLSVLAEAIADNIPDCTFLQANTDGLTVLIKRTDKDLLLSLCKKWEEMTKLTLEYENYKTMIIRDVNSYKAITIKGKVKDKGAFEIVPMQNGAIAYNKDWSMRVVPKALDAYYKEGTPIEDYIRNCTDILDFCIGFRANKGWTLKRIYAEDGFKKIEPIQRTIRYYISEVGDLLVKSDDDNPSRMIQLNSGYSSTLFNQRIDKPIKDYRIDYNFYIAEANRIRYAVYDGQLKMF